ncbi:MAG: prepilin-type N-terminal cleavage/methylation domain-containing protein [Acidobacteria bacterium]|nr:prepilin-type N-terminal cleavage/methylation domain-containing protein [Acidobacteriota bacterium]
MLNAKKHKGFSLIELLITLGILLIVSAVIISAFTSSLRSLRRETSLSRRDLDIKRALELMTLEIGQAGASPDILNPLIANPGVTTLQNATNTTTANYPATINNISLTNSTIGSSGLSVRGLYPGRQIIFGLPEGTSNSQALQVVTLPTTCTNPCAISVTNSGKSINHPSGTTITSPALPLMFGVLNPPPFASGTSLPLVDPPVKTVNRIGFIGDILSNGRLQYIEYTYDMATRRIYRSLTPLDPNDPDNIALNPNAPNKAPATVLLDDVLPGTNFTINYYSTSVPIPVSITLNIQARNAVAENRRGAATFNIVNSRTEIVSRGTAAAAFLLANGAESGLRAMTPPCNGSFPGTGYPPCAGWNTMANPWPWWNKVVSNFTARNYNDTSDELLP